MTSPHHVKKASKGLWWMPMVPSAEEGRGSLRKASGSREQAPIRGYPNGETHPVEHRIPSVEHIDGEEGTWGTETSKYPEEKKRFPK